MPAVYYAPTGPANLTALFPAINWSDVEEYTVEVLDTSNAVIATTPVFAVKGCEDDMNLSFINYLGQLDSIPLLITIEHDTKASTAQRSITYPLQRAVPGTFRTDIKGNDNYTGTILLDESQMQWFDELLDSPLAWMQVNGDYTPIIITDQSITKRKDAERYSYEVTVKWNLSHERITLSN